MSSEVKKKTVMGVVGCGGFARGNHIPNIVSNPDIDLRALCDLRTDGLEAYPHQYITTDAERVFADPEIQGVVCATKPANRFPIMELAKKYQKPLFVEKPLCWGEEETLKAVELMRDFKPAFMVGFNRQFSPMMQDVKSFFHRYCTRGNTTVLYRIVGEARLWPKSHYDAVINRGESTIIHEITHIFQLFYYLTGMFPVSVNTSGGGNTDNVITLEYPHDITAVIIAGDNSNIAFPKEYLEINGNYSTIAGYNFVELEVFGNDGVFSRKRYPYKIGKQQFITSRMEMEAHRRDVRNSFTREDIEYGYYYDKQVVVPKGHWEEIDAFRLCVENGQPSPVDLYAGAAANLIAYAAVRSWQEKRRIAIDLHELLKM